MDGDSGHGGNDDFSEEERTGEERVECRGSKGVGQTSSKFVTEEASSGEVARI